MRIVHRVVDAALAPRDAARRRRHDHAFDPTVAAVPGHAPACRKIAVFVIYQPVSLPLSVLETCGYLAQAGYAVLLVSNAPLRATDLDAFRELCWTVLERPNCGYDFGGYRDGIRFLKDRLGDCDSLVLVNDSIWLPIVPESGTLRRLEKDPAPFCGVSLEKRSGRSSGGWHYQSYLIQFKPAALQSAAFRQYWSGMRFSDTKRVVLRHGEKGLSQAMFDAGFGGQGASTRDALFAALSACDIGFLKKVLEFAAYEAVADMVEAEQLLLADTKDERWRIAVLAHMKRVMQKLHPMGAFCYAGIHLAEFGFMKKTSAFAVYPGMRWQYVRAVASGDVPAPSPAILSEIVDSHRDGRLTTAPVSARVAG